MARIPLHISRCRNAYISLSFIPRSEIAELKDMYLANITNSNYHTIALNSHASKVMLKILQARLQQYMNRELLDVQAGFKIGRGTRDPIANICWIIAQSRVPENISFCFIDYAKAFDCVDHNILWRILKEIGYQTTWPASWETYMQFRKQQLELDMEQQTGSK